MNEIVSRPKKRWRATAIDGEAAEHQRDRGCDRALP